MYPPWVYLASHATIVVVWAIGAAWLLVWPASDQPHARQRTALALVVTGGVIATAILGWTILMHGVWSTPFWPPPLTEMIEVRDALR